MIIMVMDGLELLEPSLLNRTGWLRIETSP